MSLQVMSVVPLEKGKARIRFDDGTEVVLYKGEIRKLGIEEGCVVTEAVYDKILNEILGKRCNQEGNASVGKAGPDRASAL